MALLKESVRENWYLAVALVVIAGLVAWKALAPQAGDHSAAVGSAALEAGGASAGPAPTRPLPVRLSEAEQAQQTITEYQKKLDADPKDPNAPEYLNAMGNLSHQKLRDYKEAARYYELLLNDYPDYPKTTRIYPQLVTCYEQLNDTRGLNWVYREMMAKFPPESQEYQFAKEKMDPASTYP